MMHVFNNNPLAPRVCVCVCLLLFIWTGAPVCGDVLEVAADGP